MFGCEPPNSQANERLRKEIDQRQRVEQERGLLFTRLVLAQEDERRRMARELHDQLGQQLTALRLTLETLKALSSEHPEVHRQVEALQHLARQLDQDIAFRVWELRPAVLDGLGLAAALSEYAGNWSKRFGIRAELHITRPTDERLTSETETTIYRFAQEALNNVVEARASGSCGYRPRTHAPARCRSSSRTTVIGFNAAGGTDDRRRLWTHRHARTRRARQRRFSDRVGAGQRHDDRSRVLNHRGGHDRECVSRAGSSSNPRRR